MKTPLETEITHIDKAVQQLGDMVLTNVQKVMTMVKTQSTEKYDSLIESDKKIDKKAIDTEEMCTSLIARGNPVASNLRHIVSILKVSSELERIADYAKYIIRDLKKVSPDFFMQMNILVGEMLEIGTHMVQTSITAFKEDNIKKAIESAKEDDRLDTLHRSLYKRIIKITKNTENDHILEEASSMFFINRFLERIGDHSTNICEWLYYAKTGERINLN